MGESSWQSWKLNLGAGRYLNYQCLTGDRETLGQVARAIDFALTGKDPGQSVEVMLQLSDDAGRSWIIQRRPGLVRFLRDGETLAPGVGETLLVAALMDLDEESAASAQVNIGINLFSLYTDEGRIAIRVHGTQDSGSHAFRKAIARKIKDIATAAARALSLPQIQNPKVLARLAQRLEPVYAQYREVERLAKETQATEAAPVIEEELATQHRLGQELELIEDIRINATPLLAPGVPSLKALKDSLTSTEAEIAKATEELGISVPEVHAPARDFAKAIDALSRLEAHGKLLRASLAARKYCEQRIEAPFKKYLEMLEKEFLQDKRIIQHLEACLDQINARLDAYNQDIQGPSGQASLGGPGVKTWFDRFKAKSQEEDKQDPSLSDPPSELEIARQAVGYALQKVTEIGASLGGAQNQHESALQALDSAHEELVRGLGRLRDYWLTQARELGLPEDLDLGRLLKIVVIQGQLAALVDRREDLKERVQKHAGRLARIERLVVDWRRITGSQKQSDLENTGILLQEARDIIRYYEVKRKKFDQLTTVAAASKASLSLKAMLQGRKSKLTAYWNKVFTEELVPAVDIASDQLPELFKASSYIKALALVHGESQGVTTEKVFDVRTQSAALSIYLSEEAPLDHKARLSLLSELETAQGSEMRLLLIADQSTAQSLSPLGIGMATLLPRPSTTESAPQVRTADTPRPSPTTRMPVRPATPVASSTDPNVLLADRAQRALNILSGKVR